jgi:hypothetical protein
MISSDNQIKIDNAIKSNRKYLLISYLRTPGVKKYYKDDEWVIFLHKVVSEGTEFDYSSFVHHVLLSYRLPLLAKGILTLVESSLDAEPFMINDCGVTFIDSKNAIYPYSQHEAVWISLDNTRSRTLSDDEVIGINTILMNQVYSLLGFTLDANIKSIQSYRLNHPDDGRYRALYWEMDKIDFLVDPEYTSILRTRSGVRDVNIPSEYSCYLSKEISQNDITSLRNRCDFRSLAAIEVFQRYGLLQKTFDVKGIIAQSIERNYLFWLIKWYKDKSENEFDKMCSIIFLEIASDMGCGFASDRLYRYYTKGKHLIKDPDKANFYFERACDQGSADSLKDYFKSLRKDPEYESKAKRYLKRIPKDGSLFLMIALMYKGHKDRENYLIWLEKAAKTAYTSAVTMWVSYWSTKKPIELDKIEMLNKFILKKQLGAAHILADFYYTHQDICPGKFEWFIGELKKKDNIFVSEILKKYGLD